MSLRALFLASAMLPLWLWGQSPLSASAERKQHPDSLNATTLAVLRANQPKGMSWEEWLHNMQEPANHHLYPLRITTAMLDTLDGREMDLRFRYMMVKELD
ncbi:MAG: hypothetical protein ACK4L7_03230 [Flavobacteriales bacterium]